MYIDPEELLELHWQSDWSGDEVGYDTSSVVGLYSTGKAYFYINMETYEVLEMYIEIDDDDISSLPN